MLRNRLILILTVIVSATLGFIIFVRTINQEENSAQNSEDHMQEFVLNGQRIVISENSLEAIRKVVHDRLADQDGETFALLADEIGRSMAMVGPDESRIGRWVLSERSDGLSLVRIPPRNEVNYIFVSKLHFEDGVWSAETVLQERMSAL